MLNRNVSILSFALLAAFVLIGFQNCGSTSSEMSSKSNSDPEQRIVDDWAKADLQFASSKVQVHDEAQSTGVSGLCNRQHNGARLRWALWADDHGTVPLFEGDGLCKSGQFSVEIDQLDNMVCGIAHRLVVEGDWGGTAAAQFEKRCQPLASEHVEAPESSPMGTDCSLEYVPAAGPSNSCLKVCYRDDKVVLNVTVDPVRCSNLVQKLASP
jgi:hypothetical protein